MKINKKAFTLVELLVVVLIIGILAAIAVPQYEKAVEKSRTTQALAFMKTLYQAQQVYFLANGDYPNNFNDIDVNIPWTENEKWFTGTSAMDSRSDGKWSVQLLKGGTPGILMGHISGKYKGAGFAVYQTHGVIPSGQIVCFERKAEGVIFKDDDGEYCRKVLGGTKLPEASSTHNIYTIPW